MVFQFFLNRSHRKKRDALVHVLDGKHGRVGGGARGPERPVAEGLRRGAAAGRARPGGPVRGQAEEGAVRRLGPGPGLPVLDALPRVGEFYM